MNCTVTRIPYSHTGAFSKIALDYASQHNALQPFQSHPVTVAGLQQSIAARKQFNTNRALLVEALKEQYKLVEQGEKLQKNIEALLSENTFTITTAHQNNIFTGPLYFIYKILHAIKLAEQLTESLPGNHFVPVYYMGSEDADLDELNHIWIDGQKLVWETQQTGAVGRMKIDKALLKIIDAAEGQIAVLPQGAEIIQLIRQFYKEGCTIQDATFGLVNALFAEYGLIVLIPDNPLLKKQMIPIFTDELLHQQASGIVEKTAARLDAAGYKVQANPREINLFYIHANLRERIEKKNEQYTVVNTQLIFSATELINELQTHPERFSPNVILRGLFQETILPNIAFIGGGGETAYWLQLKDLFTFYKIPFPVLILRNSFLVVEKKWQERISKLGFTIEDMFLSSEQLLNKLVERDSDKKIYLNGTFASTDQLYESIRQQAAAIDSSLGKHVDALKTKAVYRLRELEKKMLRAEKRKFADQQRQIKTIKEKLFPENGLQERIDNFMPFYAKWGKEFLRQLHQHSLTLEQEFVVLLEK